MVTVRSSHNQRGSTQAAVHLGSDERARLAGGLGLLRRNVAEARPVLETLLAGRVVVTPRVIAGELHAYDVRIALTTRAILQETCGSQGVASPIFASWNQLDGWLRQVEALRRVA